MCDTEQGEYSQEILFDFSTFDLARELAKTAAGGAVNGRRRPR
jgi:hypothetical protein